MNLQNNEPSSVRVTPCITKAVNTPLAFSELLWSDIQDFQGGLFVGHRLLDPVDVILGRTGAQQRRVDAEATQREELVFHEGHQRRNHKRYSLVKHHMHDFNPYSSLQYPVKYL